MRTKFCFGCGEEKPLGEFYKDAKRPDGVRPGSCKECVRIAVRTRSRYTRNALRPHNVGICTFAQVESAVREMAELQAAIDKENARCDSQVSQCRAFCEETTTPWQSHLAKMRLMIKKWLEEKYGQADRAITVRCEYGIIRFYKNKFEIELKADKAIERLGKPSREPSTHTECDASARSKHF